MRNHDEIREALTGPVPSLCTPFEQNGDIDYDGLRNMIDFQIDAGAKTIMLTAGDSHYTCFSREEIARITEVTVEHTAGRAMVLAADWHYSTGHALKFADYLSDLGVDLYMVSPPDWAESCTPETMAEHYSLVAERIPVMVVTGVFVGRGMAFGLKTLELVLARTKGVAAIKDDFCGEFGRKMATMVHDRWAMLSGGMKQNHMDIHPYGCDGYLSTYMRLKPEIACKYWDAIQANKITEAAGIIRDYDIPLFDYLCALPGNFNSGIHGAFELFGIAKRWRRKPYYSLNDEEMERLADFFKSKSLL